MLPPEVPGGLTLVGATSSALVLSWTALPAGVVARIQVQPAGNDWSSASETSPAVPSLSIDTCGGMALQPNTAYDVRMRAENSAGVSDWVMLTGLLTAPPRPTDLSAQSGGYGIVNLTWTAYPEVYYVVLRDGSALTSIATPPFADIIGTPGVWATYQIAATNGVASSDLSYAVSIVSGAGSAPYNLVPAMISSDTTPTNPGAVLTVSSTGAWSGDPAPSQTAGQWRRDDVDIPGQTGTSYTVVTDDIGHVISYRETFSNAVGADNSTSSGITVTAPEAPARLSDPVIDAVGADFNQGATLYVASPGAWSGNPTSFSYLWYCNGTSLGSDGTSITASNTGTYQCIVTATNAVGSTDAPSNYASVTSPG